MNRDADGNLLQLGEHLYSVLSEDGYLYITGYGDMYNFTSSPFKNPKLIKTVELDDQDDEEDEETDPPKPRRYITSIGDHVFDGASNLTAIYTSNKIRRIGNYAFRNCSALEGFRYGGPDDTSNELLLPADLQYIGNSAFENCDSANFGDVVVSSLVTYIGSKAFRNCKNITSVDVSGSVGTLGGEAFSDCESMTSAVIHDGVNEIGQYVFGECKSLESLTIPYAGNALAAANDGTAEPVYSWFFNGNYSPAGYYKANKHGIPNQKPCIGCSCG